MRRLTILLLSLALLLALPGCSAREQSIYEQDYDYLWYLLENEYPHYYVAERLMDRDLDEIKAQYAALLPEVGTTQEFYELIIAPCLSDIGYVGHLGVLYYDEYQLRLYNAENYPQPYDTFTYDTLTAPAVREFYEQMKVTAGTGAVSGAETDTSNLEVDYYPEQKAAYVKVHMMLNDVDPDGELLRAFFMDIEEQGYEHCIIDIRENPGGTDWYWKKNLVMPNITEDTYSTFYALFSGEYSREYVDLLFDTYPLEELPVETMPELSEDDLSIATGCARVDIGMYAQEGEEPLFTGKFWLLVGPRVYSASEMFTVFAKYTGFATIVGERTGGDGISMQPLVRALPNTGICLKYTAMLGLNPDGTANSEVGTTPDYECHPAITLLKCLDLIEEGT